MLKFKHDINYKDAEMLTAAATWLLGYTMQWCALNNIRCELTSLAEHVDGRQSATHSTGRAFDISVRHFPSQQLIYKFVHDVNSKCAKTIGAFSRSDGVARAAIYHKIDGNVMHLHLQVRYQNDINTSDFLELMNN